MGETSRKTPSWRHAVTWGLAAGLAVMLAVDVFGQGRGRGGQQNQPPNVNPPIDLTGYWVSVVTEGWRFRMPVPKKGDYESTAMTPAARAIADAWDPAKDEAAGEQCRWYGAGGVMRIPGRLHITWEGADTLRVETSAGTQTRLFHFDRAAPPPAAPTWQGHSLATWTRTRGGREPGSRPGGQLTVVTDHLRMGYMRRNGVPYSDQLVMTEYFNVLQEPDGGTWLVVTTEYKDPVYMTRPFYESTHFKKEPDGSKWDPTPCSAFE